MSFHDSIAEAPVISHQQMVLRGDSLPISRCISALTTTACSVRSVTRCARLQKVAIEVVIDTWDAWQEREAAFIKFGSSYYDTILRNDVTGLSTERCIT